MNPDSPDSPETYPPLPSLIIIPEEEKYSFRFVCLLMLGSFLGAVLILGIIFTALQLGYSENFIPDHICNSKMNESFINGIRLGGEYVIAIITNEVIQCKTFPLSYSGFNYTLVAVECLNEYKKEVKS